MVHAGVLTFSQALGILLGANIGMTIGGQIIAFDIAKYARHFCWSDCLSTSSAPTIAGRTGAWR